METFRTPSLSHAQCKASDTTHQPPLLQQVKTLQKNAKAKPCEVVQCHWELTGSEAALQSSWPSVPAARYGPAREGTAGEERARAQRQPPGPSGSTQPAPSPAGVPAAAAGSTHRHSTLPSAPSPTPQTLRLRSRPASGRGGTRPPCPPGRPPFRGRPASPLRTEPCQTGALSADSRPDLPRSEGGRHREMEGGTARPGTAPPSPAQAGTPSGRHRPAPPRPDPAGRCLGGGRLPAAQPGARLAWPGLVGFFDSYKRKRPDIRRFARSAERWRSTWRCWCSARLPNHASGSSDPWLSPPGPHAGISIAAGNTSQQT